MSNYEFTNAEKRKHGESAIESLHQILISEQKAGFLKYITRDYTILKTGYTDSPFSAHFLIEFYDGTQWILYSTASYRSDRLKEQQWESLNCKQENEKITKAFLICPDTLKINERFLIRGVSENISNGTKYSEIDAIIVQADLRKLIEEKALENKTEAQVKDIQGKAFEQRIADIMSNPNNIEKFKTNDRTIEGVNYNTFVALTELFKIDKNTLDIIVATTDKNIIGKLPSGGNPKTDVLIQAITTTKNQQNFTVSCKRSSAKTVSVHQYSAKDFSKVLNPNDEELLYLLNEFQKWGGIQQFGKENAEKLTSKLNPYIRKLTMWVLGGIGGQGNSETQHANYIVVYNNKTDQLTAYTTETYCDLLLKEPPNHFGTPFLWTYASGSKGKNIQLKCKVL